MSNFKFLNIRLDDELTSLIERAKKELCITPCGLARKLLKSALQELLEEKETK